MGEGDDKRADQTAKHRRSSGDLPLRRDAPDERFSLPKEIPDHILEEMDLPSAPSAPKPIPRPPPPMVTVPKPLGKTKSIFPAPVRRPGQRVVQKSTPAGTSEASVALLSGAELFQKGAELPSIGEFAGYKILGRLAIGGMAEILLARKPGQAKPIVLKKILATYDRDDEFVEMFLDEARVGMQLDHPHIARFLDAGEDGGRYFIAMEWVNGVTLAKLVRRARHSGGVPPVMASAIVRAVADALHYAHTSRDANDDLMGLIHRDVSPHNIMVGYDGSVKLLDFGIAKAMGAAHITAAGVVKGKFAYMAPEQCEGEPIDFRSDIFALGVVLFEALSGETLYRRDSDRETVRVITRDPVPSLSAHWKEAPRELEAICSTALAKDPAERFPTSAAMRDVLTLFIDGQGTDVRQERIAELVQSIFATELRSGPNVDSSPLSSSLGAINEPATGTPTVGPPPSSPTLDAPTVAPPRPNSPLPEAPIPTTPAPVADLAPLHERLDETPTHGHEVPDLPEIDHAWTEERTAVQSAEDRNAVLREIQAARALESGEGPAEVGYEVDVDLSNSEPPPPATPSFEPPASMPSPRNDASPSSPPPKKGNGALLAVLLLVVAAAGAVAAWYFFFRG